MARMDERDEPGPASAESGRHDSAVDLEARRENERLRQEIARLSDQLRQHDAELQERSLQVAELQAQQDATSDVLRIIAGSRRDVGPVLDAVAECSARLCDGGIVNIHRIQDGMLHLAAIFSVDPDAPTTWGAGDVRPIGGTTVTGRAVMDRRTVHVDDLAAAVETDFPDSRRFQQIVGHRTILATPLLREGVPIGAITIGRWQVRPFSETEIKLAETFADQAAIAIENARLFGELEQRTSELSRALEEQTATSDVLRIIAGSSVDEHPVLEAIAEGAARLCEAENVAVFRVAGDRVRLVAICGERLAPNVGIELPIARGSLAGRSIVDRQTYQVLDMDAVWDELPDARRMLSRASGTALATPLLLDGIALGAVVVRRFQVREFTEEQIRLLETFADQAVIAIENARLFKELERRTQELARSVEELRALGEVGQAVSSTLDLGQVLNTVVTHADRLSGTDGAVLYEYDDATGEFHVRATHQLDATVVAAVRAAPFRLGEGAVGRAALARVPVQIPDMTEVGAYEARVRDAMIGAGHRAVLAVPLLREGSILGGLAVIRKSPGTFPVPVVELLQTFAGHSVIAIENARLFQQIEEKSHELEIASRHKSAFLANMSHELRTGLLATIGFSELLLEGVYGDLAEQQAASVQDILGAGRHVLSLINDALDLAKVEAGRLELELASVSLLDVLEQGRTLLKERAGRHRIAVEVEVDPALGPIVADERKVKQVVLNLVSNAVKFTPDGGYVELSARRVDDEVQVAVRDTGVGIAPEDQEQIFEEFRRVGVAANKVEGTGLGLALARKLVKLHGGRIWVESEPDVGSTFTFALPIRPSAGPTDAHGAAPAPRAGASG